MRICVLVFGLAFSVAASADRPVLQQDPASAKLYDLATREAQYNALRAIPDVQVQYGSFGRLKQLDGLTGIRVPQARSLKRGDSADVLFQSVKHMLLARNDSKALVVSESGTEPFGTNRFVFTDQVIDGIPVIDARVNFLLDSNDEIKLIVSQFVPRGNASTTPQMSEQTAKTRLEQTLRDAQRSAAQPVSRGSLAFWTDQGRAQVPRLLWIFTTDSARIGIDAATGEVRYAERLTSDLQRTVYTHNYRSDTNFPQASALLWTEGHVPASPDPQGLGIYQRVVYPVNAWVTHPFAYDVMGLVAHWGRPSNGMYKDNGSRATAYLYFSDERAVDDDAIAHEYGHGLFVDGPLRPTSIIPKPWDEFFAGSEFWGDYSAVMTNIHRYGMRGDLTWAITDLRNWRDPRSKSIFFQDWYPNRSFINFVLGTEYANSTIFGHGVYLMIHGGTHRRAGQPQYDGSFDPSVIPAINVTAADHGQIKQVLSTGVWLMRLYNDKFDGPAYKTRTVQAATQLFGTSPIVTTVGQAWTAVGIGSGCSGKPAKPVITEFLNQYCRGKFKVSWQQVFGVKYHAEITPVEQSSFESALTVSVLDSATNLCRPTISRDSLWRMRACNGCGCSDWTSPLWMSYFSTCQ